MVAGPQPPLNYRAEELGIHFTIKFAHMDHIFHLKRRSEIPGVVSMFWLLSKAEHMSPIFFFLSNTEELKQWLGSGSGKLAKWSFSNPLQPAAFSSWAG